MQDINTLLPFAERKDLEYDAILKSAIQQHEGRERGAKTIQQYLSRDRRGDFNLVNPFSRRTFRKCLLQEVGDIGADQLANAGVVMLATFVDREWACSDRAYNFCFPKAKQKENGHAHSKVPHAHPPTGD